MDKIKEDFDPDIHILQGHDIIDYAYFITKHDDIMALTIGTIYKYPRVTATDGNKIFMIVKKEDGEMAHMEISIDIDSSWMILADEDGKYTVFIICIKYPTRRLNKNDSLSTIKPQ
jgi:hypothetical protein